MAPYSRLLPSEAVEALAGIESAYAELFGVAPEGLRDELERLEYDHFDAERGVVRMGWSDERPAYSLWTLAHELAHAYEFRYDPQAYAREPSWIHEGLAEYAVFVWKQAEDPGGALQFSRSAERARRESGVEFAAVFADVYAFEWQVAYPLCFLEVRALAERRGTRAVLDYFASHGQGDPAEELARAFDRVP